MEVQQHANIQQLRLLLTVQFQTKIRAHISERFWVSLSLLVHSFPSSMWARLVKTYISFSLRLLNKSLSDSQSADMHAILFFVGITVECAPPISAASQFAYAKNRTCHRDTSMSLAWLAEQRTTRGAWVRVQISVMFSFIICLFVSGWYLKSSIDFAC